MNCATSSANPGFSSLRGASLRSLLAILSLLTMLPTVALLAYFARRDHERQVQALQEEALRLNESCGASAAQLVEGARQTLLALAHSAEVRTLDAKAASALMAEVMMDSTRYSNLIVVAPDGTVAASGVPLTSTVNTRDRSWFPGPDNDHAFIVGEYHVGRITGKPGISFGVPLPAEPGKRSPGSIAAAMSQEAFQDCITNIPLPEGGVLNIVDRNGIILARNPDPRKWIGVRSSAWTGFHAIDPAGSPFVETAGVDGIARLYHFSRVAGSDGGLFVGIGVPKAQLAEMSRRVTLLNTFLLSLATLGALAVAHVVAHFWVLRPIRRLAATSRRLAGGDLGERTRIVGAPVEIQNLATDFDSMADSVEKNLGELQLYQAQLESMVHERTAQLAKAFDDLVEEQSGREKLIEDLTQALAEVRTLSGLLPICSSCKKIRDDKGYWVRIESYFSQRSGTQFSHGLCPDCLKRLYPNLAEGASQDPNPPPPPRL